jgi:hypothetical protein
MKVYSACPVKFNTEDEGNIPIAITNNTEINESGFMLPSTI